MPALRVHGNSIVQSALEYLVLLVSNNVVLSEISAITTEHQLVTAIRDFLLRDHELKWRFLSEPNADIDRGYDALLSLTLDGRPLTFAAEYKVAVSARNVEALAKRKLPHPLLLNTANLTENILRLCREHHINCLDLNGRASIRHDGVFIERAASARPAFRPAQSPPDVFSSKSSRLVRTLLAEKVRAWSQSELVAETQLSVGLVSRLTRHLHDEGFLHRDKRTFRVARPDDPRAGSTRLSALRVFSPKRGGHPACRLRQAPAFARFASCSGPLRVLFRSAARPVLSLRSERVTKYLRLVRRSESR